MQIARDFSPELKAPCLACSIAVPEGGGGAGGVQL